MCEGGFFTPWHLNGVFYLVSGTFRLSKEGHMVVNFVRERSKDGPHAAMSQDFWSGVRWML
jgi:hypothetical protein